MTAITKKIIGFSVVKKDDKKGDNSANDGPIAVQIPDNDPGRVRIESRPEGGLPAISEKIAYNTSEGKRKVYILVSFMPVKGRLDGKDITVERPIEFFYPVGQGTSEHQWISASMRSLSLAARGGYAAQALIDLQKVSWDKGPVRCGTNEHGKPKYHDSEVAAIAWSLQRILKRRGFLDSAGNQVPSRVLAKHQLEPEILDIDEELAPVVETNDFVADASVPVESMTGVVGQCPDCEGHLRLRDGCPSCDCGYSRC